jgi:hypothetical protein
VTKAQTVTVIEPDQAQLPAVAESAAILSVIERAARDPAVDIDKMERLMAMHERMLARQAKAAYSAALAELQPKLPVVSERGGITNSAGKVQSTYALWEDVVTAITPMLSAHGFALSFRVGRDGDRQTVTGILSHRDGHSEETTLSLPLDMSGSKNAVQGVGSTVSGGEDDDGQGGKGNTLITAEQKQQLVALMQETGVNTEKFLQYMAVTALDEIKAANFNKAKTALEARRAKAS